MYLLANYIEDKSLEVTLFIHLDYAARVACSK